MTESSSGETPAPAPHAHAQIAARVLNCGGGLNNARLSSRTDVENSGSDSLPTIGKVMGHPFPAPGGKPDGAAKGETL